MSSFLKPLKIKQFLEVNQCSEWKSCYLEVCGGGLGGGDVVVRQMSGVFLIHEIVLG